MLRPLRACLLTFLLVTLLTAPIDSQQHDRKSAELPQEFMARRPECGTLLPPRDERHDLARLALHEQFLDWGRAGLPKNLAPPWKTSDEGTKKLSDACERFAAKSARDYPQVGPETSRERAIFSRVSIDGTVWPFSMSPCDSCFDSRNSFKRFPITMMFSCACRTLAKEHLSQNTRAKP